MKYNLYYLNYKWINFTVEEYCSASGVSLRVRTWPLFRVIEIDWIGKVDGCGLEQECY